MASGSPQSIAALSQNISVSPEMSFCPASQQKKSISDEELVAMLKLECCQDMDVEQFPSSSESFQSTTSKLETDIPMESSDEFSIQDPNTLSQGSREQRSSSNFTSLGLATSEPRDDSFSSDDLESDTPAKDSDDLSIQDLNSLSQVSRGQLSPSDSAHLALAFSGTIDDSFSSEDLKTLSASVLTLEHGPSARESGIPSQPESESTALTSGCESSSQSEPERPTSQYVNNTVPRPSFVDLTTESSGDSSSDLDSDSDMSDAPIDRTPIRIPFPPKERGNRPRTKGTKTKLVTFASRDLNGKERYVWRRYQEENPTARLECIGEKKVITVVTSTLTRRQQLKQELRIKKKREEAAFAQQEENERHNIVVDYLLGRQLTKFRAGKVGTGNLMWDEEVKGYSRKEKKTYERDNCVDALDLRIECNKIHLDRLEGREWELKSEYADAEDLMEQSFLEGIVIESIEAEQDL